jgi:transcription-repair coupling factor (superfamily II helicase)
MDLTRLLELINDLPGYQILRNNLEQASKAVDTSVIDAAKPYLISALYRSRQKPMLLVTAGPEQSRWFYEQMTTWLISDRIKLLPEPESLSYERVATDTSTEQERLQVLATLTDVKTGVDQPLVVASAASLMHPTMPRREFIAAHYMVTAGMEIEPLKLLEKWQSLGYRLENVVEMPGSMSHRGGIIDIFPPASEFPARLEFMGNTIESLRTFDPSTQRSIATLTSLYAGPATEVLAPLTMDIRDLESLINNLDLNACNSDTLQYFEHDLALLRERQRPHDMPLYAALFNRDSLISYLPEDCLIVIDNQAAVSQAMEDIDKEAQALRESRIGRGELPANFPVPYITWTGLESELHPRPILRLSAWSGFGEQLSIPLEFTSISGYAGQLPAFVNRVKQLLEQKCRLVVVSHQASRLSELLEAEDILATPITDIKELPSPGLLTLVQGLLSEGWVMNNRDYLFTDAEVFGFIKQRRQVKKRPVPHHKLTLEYAEGDYVVHVEHGIGRFAGIVKRSIENKEKEYLILKYSSGDRLFVPADQVDRISRYVGSGERLPVLSRLGTQEWTRNKQRTKEAVEEVAKELLSLYASREVVTGYTFSPDTVWQQELEASFPYVETPDQIKVQGDVKQDMEKPRPMDRLVCGDVGYGKTEVALRAAFKAVMDGKQVAVLVPTTVLAQQHYVTFTQRLEAFPIKIDVLSRFRTPREQQDILTRLADGTIDLCIGTHRLIQKDVQFNNLGLLIIDEEQRFGVAHKEYLKRKRQEVDVLTLSATPIPRTLHMSLAGVRDMSTMETPPEQRLPIKTYVAEYDDQIVREAIMRELERHGQVFFVHNRVRSIAGVAAKLRELVPEARIAVGHGRMRGVELERITADFARGNSDVFLCTTIIESGLDMPNVNTLIINQADRFGLTQLYQLRGRVGRGASLAYAYFLYDRGKRLTPTADKRLKTIYEATELGAGFNIAMKDLEIRGAGTLLGKKQSGQISAVGFNLYTRLLADAVAELKAIRTGMPLTDKPLYPPPSIDLPLRAYIPEEYIADLDTRLGLYQRLSRLENMNSVEDMVKELADRFGAPPSEVLDLLYAVRLRILGIKVNIESIATADSEIVVRIFPGLRFDTSRLAQLIKDGVKPGLNQIRIDIKKTKRWREILEELLSKLKAPVRITN